MNVTGRGGIAYGKSEKGQPLYGGCPCKSIPADKCWIRLRPPNPLDWNQPAPDENFDFIIGSEIIYHERDFDPIRGVFERLLKPGGEVILCAEIRKTNMAFLSLLQNTYAIKARKKTLRSEAKNISVMLCHLSPKEG